MADIWKDFVKQTVSAVASSGTGAFTLSTPSSGFQALAAGDNAGTGFFVATEGVKWQTFWGTYTHSGTSLARTTAIDGSAGLATNETFTTAAIVHLDMVALAAKAMKNAAQATTPGGRLTLTTGVPVTTSDVTAAATIYYTPFIHNIINLWDGKMWVPTVFAEVPLALGTITSGLPYDMFAYLNAGAFDTAEMLAWTNGTTRATAITLQDGRYCKSGDKTRLYLGTFYTTATTTTEDSEAKRFVFNMYNRERRSLRRHDATASWTYATATFRQANASASNQVEAIFGLAELVDLVLKCDAGLAVTAGGAILAIGEDSTTTPATEGTSGYFTDTIARTLTLPPAILRKLAAVGYHKYTWLEQSTAGTTTFYGDDSGVGRGYAGLAGHVVA